MSDYYSVYSDGGPMQPPEPTEYPTQEELLRKHCNLSSTDNMLVNHVSPIAIGIDEILTY